MAKDEKGSLGMSDIEPKPKRQVRRVQRNKRKIFNKGYIFVGAARRDPGRGKIKSRSEGSLEVGQVWLILGGALSISRGEQRKPCCDGNLLGLRP
jgi:hypothetical protein